MNHFYYWKLKHNKIKNIISIIILNRNISKLRSFRLMSYLKFLFLLLRDCHNEMWAFPSSYTLATCISWLRGIWLEQRFWASTLTKISLPVIVSSVTTCYLCTNMPLMIQYTTYLLRIGIWIIIILHFPPFIKFIQLSLPRPPWAYTL